ncbi:hypothetical protein XENOCAPTIV_030683 [Xenoophorus captivus]|uniref:ABC transmembrane type-1 domain-containing protein n=1 Tax=Xenoophorus captivus TaxID=1517983 RepID=A0ABV0RMS1_9TELE
MTVNLFILLLRLMISFIQDKSSYAWEGYLYAVLLLVVALLQSLFLQQYFQRCFVLGMKVRTALMAAVYKKVSTGMTARHGLDSEILPQERFNDVTNFIHLLWSCPLQIIISIVFLWIELGPSTLAGLAVMVLMILKLFAWEPSFQAQVEDIRGKELKVMRKFAYLTSVSTFIFTCAPALTTVSKKRLEKFLGGDDLDSDIVHHDTSFSTLTIYWYIFFYPEE